MTPTEQDVLEALRTVRYPGFTRDIVSFGIVEDVRVAGGAVRFRLKLGPGSPAVLGQIETEARAAVQRVPGVETIEVEPVHPVAASAGVPRGAGAVPEEGLLPGVRHVVAVASGKGGVGKSTVAVNLALALARLGMRVGLLDADIYGPSIPLMMGVDETPRVRGGTIEPHVRDGVRFMSLGFLVDPGTAVIWRGPMVMKALTQLLDQVEWGELDVLVVDLPPGTGDAQLTLSQKVRLAGAVIVTTPQDVALADAIKGVAMFQKVGVPVLGIVENMSVFVCPHCGGTTDIFGHGGGRAEATRLGVPLLGEIALDASIREGGDRGRPVVVDAPDSEPARAFLAIARSVLASLGEAEPKPAAPGGGLLGWLRRGPAEPRSGG